MSAQIRVLIVDDQPRARQSLRALLATWPLATTVGEAGDGLEALDLMEQAAPDLVLMDAYMPVMNGIAATQSARERWPQLRLVVLSISGDCQAEALAAGADAFLNKADVPQQLLPLIARLAEMAGWQGSE